MNINPTSLYWATFDRFEFRLPGQCVVECSHSGDCQADCEKWLPAVLAQIEADNFPLQPTPENVKEELKEYGTWDEAELNDETQNWIRLIWIAAGNIMDDDARDDSEPLKNVVLVE